MREDEKTRHESDVEITDLDPPGISHTVFGLRIILANRWHSRRWFQPLWVVMAGVALLFLLLATLPSAPKAARPAGTPALAEPTFVPRSLTLLDGVMYVIVSGGSLNALHASSGSLLWRHEGLANDYPVATTNAVVVLVEQQNGTVDALRVIDGSLLWQYTPRMGFTWPSVANGIVYVNDRKQVKALRASDGTLIWQQNLAVSGFWVVGGGVYAVPDVGTVGAFRGSSGAVLWRHIIAGRILGVGDGRVYLEVWDHSLAALRTSDGAVLWRQKSVQADTLSSQTNGALYFLTSGGQLDALSGSSGSLLWHKHIPTAKLAGMTVSADDQVVYLSYANGDEDFLRARDGSLLWHSSSATNGSAFNVEADHNLIYLSAPDGGVDARRVTDGTLLWHRRVTGTVLLVETGVIYFSTTNGTLNAIRGSDGMLLWHRVLSLPSLPFNSPAQQALAAFVGETAW